MGDMETNSLAEDINNSEDVMETNFREDSSKPISMVSQKITKEWKNHMGNSLLY